MIAILNHLIVFGPTVPPEYKPPAYLKAWSLIGIVIMVALGLPYIWIRYL